MPRKIEMTPYDPAWPEMYRIEVERISVAVGSNLVAAHHIGSTAVPGLAAKPTVDILLVVIDLFALDACTPIMETLGYKSKGENGIKGRRYFQKLDGDRHLFHVHAFTDGHPEITRNINFRDFLIAHPDTAQAYQELKQDLAAQFRDAPGQYTSGKSDFITTVDSRAAAWRAGLKSDDPSIHR